MTRDVGLSIFTVVIQVVISWACHHHHNHDIQKAHGCNCMCFDQNIQNQRASAGCISFGNSDGQQGMDVICPEVHVETCTNPCTMTTQAYTVPKSCCCAPYCSIPGPTQQTICTTQPVFPTISCTNKNPSMPPMQPPPAQQPPPLMPPRPSSPHQQMYPCCNPYGMPFQMAPAAPSYCVQSVVVGGKSDSKKDDDKGEPKKDDETGDKPTGSQGGENPGNQTTGGGGTGGGQPSPRPGLGAYLDPILAGLGGGLGGLGGFDPIALGAGPLGAGLLNTVRKKQTEEDDTKRYETYLEKILDVIKDKVEPECVEPSPIMVMPQPCGCRLRKIRRRKQRKYVVESCDEPDEVVEEEEESPCLLASPCNCVRSCGCGMRRRRRYQYC